MKHRLFIVFIAFLLFSCLSHMSAEREALNGAYERYDRNWDKQKILVEDDQVQMTTVGMSSVVSNHGVILAFHKAESVFEIQFYKSIRSHYNFVSPIRFLINTKVFLRADSIGAKGEYVRLEQVVFDSLNSSYVNLEAYQDRSTKIRRGWKEQKRSPRFYRIDKLVDIYNKGGFHCTCPRAEKKYKTHEVWFVNQKKITLPVPDGISSLQRKYYRKVKKRLKRITNYGEGTTFMMTRKESKTVAISILFNDTGLEDSKLKEMLFSKFGQKYFLEEDSANLLYFDVETYKGKLIIHSPLEG